MRRMYTASSNCSLFTKKRKRIVVKISEWISTKTLCVLVTFILLALYSARTPTAIGSVLAWMLPLLLLAKSPLPVNGTNWRKRERAIYRPRPLSTDQMQPSHLLQAVNGTHSEERERGSFWITRTKSGAGLSSNCEYWLLCVSLAVLAMIRY